MQRGANDGDEEQICKDVYSIWRPERHSIRLSRFLDRSTMGNKQNETTTISNQPNHNDNSICNSKHNVERLWWNLQTLALTLCSPHRRVQPKPSSDCAWMLGCVTRCMTVEAKAYQVHESAWRSRNVEIKVRRPSSYKSN